jgi:site-specific recombinase
MAEQFERTSQAPQRSARKSAMTVVVAPVALEATLEQFTVEGSDPVLLLRGLIDAIRPGDRRDGAAATANWRRMNEILAANGAVRQAVGGKIVELLATRRLLSFFAEEGILPGTGFFTEFGRKIAHKLLPELLDQSNFKDCLDLIFHEPHDHIWFSAIPIADKVAFWGSLDPWQAPDRAPFNSVVEQLLEAMLVVSHRTVALAFHPEFRRVCAEVEDQASPFLALHGELSAFVERYRASLAGAPLGPGSDADAAKVLAACRVELTDAYVAALARGVSLPLTYLLARLDQLLDRIGLLLGLFAARGQEELRPQLQGELADFLRTTVICETQRNSIRKHFSDLIGLLALRITENASRTGEHYITTGWLDYRAMWYSAMGAGFVVAFMALMKLSVSGITFAPIGSALVLSLIYGLGFVFIALMHFTVATKQPAMTAASIANAMNTSEGKLREDGRLVSLIVDTLRSQIAAILGNIVLATATATAIGWLLTAHFGRPFIGEEEANYLLKQLKPQNGLNLLYAGFAGVWLFVAGLLAGYFDNKATYSRIGERVGWLRWLIALVGRDRAQRFGDFVDRNLGSLMGNFLFGCMLGSTGAIGHILGLPLDVRHVTFSATNLAYALSALDYQIETSVLIQCCIGIALIGLINLTVSFMLALIVALRSRNANLAAIPSLFRHVFKRLLHDPLRVLIPPRAGPTSAHTDPAANRAH